MENNSDIANANTASAHYDYTINLMWINRKLNETQQYIYPASNEKELSKKFLNYIFKWASVNQSSIVYLWFDSALTPPTAIKNTEKLITEYIKKHQEIAPIILRDVRKLPYVKTNPEVFSDKIPIFFRVDLLRVIAQVHDISVGITPYFVYSDIDINPLAQEEIFDKETTQKLQTFGIVMMYHPIWQGFENGFSIVSNNNAHLLKAMTYTLIDLNIQRAYNALQDKFYKAEHVSEIMPIIKRDINNQANNVEAAQQSPSIPQNYSINIMWINNKLKESQQYIHPGLNEEELQEHFFQHIVTWAAMNPKNQINLWFDSLTTPDTAVKNTTQLINETHPEMSNIILRDIRDIPYVQDHPSLFSQRTPEFRNKLLQIITAMFDISTERVSYCIFGNLLDLIEYKDLFDLKSLSSQELFDEQTMKNLQKYGITITCKSGITKGVIGGNTTRLFELLSHDWIKPNSEKADNKCHDINCCGTCCASLSLLQQIMYCSYPDMFKYLYHHMEFGKLNVENFDHSSGQFITHKYNKEKDGLSPFGLDRPTIKKDFDAYTQLPKTGIGSIWIPTKKIAHQKPTLIYEDEAPVRSFSFKQKEI